MPLKKSSHDSVDLLPSLGVNQYFQGAKSQPEVLLSSPESMILGMLDLALFIQNILS